MRADSYYAMGRTHAVCEDYARVGLLENGLPYALLADGCSSSQDTDIGARVLVLSAENMLQVCGSETFPASRCIALAASQQRNLKIPVECLDATLMVVHPITETSVEVLVYGDGVVAVQGKEGEVTIYQIEYPSGAPDYLSYRLNPARYGNYKEFFGTTRKLRVFQNGAWGEEQESNGPFALNFDMGELKTVLLFSDGVASFQEWDEDGLFPHSVPVEQVVEQVFAIKNWNGPFITRRVRKFLSGFCPKNRWQHNDDFSVVAVTTRD